MNFNEKPKLKLNKRTIANLNNMEMRYVRGGDGDDDVSRNGCNGDPDEELLSKIKEAAAKIALSIALTCEKIG